MRYLARPRHYGAGEDPNCRVVPEGRRESEHEEPAEAVDVKGPAFESQYPDELGKSTYKKL